MKRSLIFKNIKPAANNATVSEKIQWFKKHNHWCAKPFHTVQIDVDTAGNNIIVKPCCNYRESELGLLPPLEQFAQLRNDIIQGVKHAACWQCHDVEKFNDYSERVRDTVFWDGSSINELLFTGKTNEFNFGIKFSNFCNLACRSCDPTVSSTYATVTKLTDVKYKPRDISHTPVWQSVLDYTKQLTETYDLVHIGLIGGETMVQEGASQYIEYLASLPKVNNIVLRITSNFTSLDEKLFKHMNKFRRVDLTASVDSTGENYHYVRWPAKFSKIQNNIAEYQKIRSKATTITNLTIASVFGLNNIFYIKEYLDFLHEQLTQHPDTIVHVLHLSIPEMQSIENLPVRYRSSLLPYIQQALNHPVLTLPNSTSMLLFLQGVESFLKTDQIKHELFNEFLKFTAEFDQHTDCYFDKFNSRLYNILNDTDIDYYKKQLNYDYNN